MLSGISIYQLGIIALIVILIFGTRKLRNLGSDIGGNIKGFKDAIKSEEGEDEYGVVDAAKDIRKAKKAAAILKKVV